MTLAEVLAAHQVKTPFDGVTCRACKWMAKDAYADHLVREIAAAGYSVVKLPKGEGRPGEEFEFYAPANGNHVRLRWSGDIVVDGNWYRADEARDVAAALLAAAAAAEHPGTPVEASQQEATK
jgi:hypothetical protein